MHCAIVDIGSNTVRMCVYCVEQSGSFVQIHKESRTLELLSHVENGVMNARGTQLLVDTLQAFSACLSKLNIPTLHAHAFATAGFRKLQDAPALCARIYAETGWQIEVLSGEEEAACSFAGLLLRYPTAQKGTMIDMGGGSTEFLKFDQGEQTQAISKPFGCVFLRKQFVAGQIPAQEEASSIRVFVTDTLQKLEYATGEALYLVGGTANAMGALYRRIYGGTGVLSPDRVQDLILRFGTPNAQDHALLAEMFPLRVQSAMVGMLAYGAIFACLAPTEIHVSDAGVREGYLVRKLQKSRG